MKKKLDNVPKELKNASRWVCYKLEQKEGKEKLDKIPKNAITGGNAQSNNSDTWCDFKTACDGLRKYRFDGLGFMLGGGFFGIDIDNINSDIQAYKNGEYCIINEFLDSLKSYAEYSPSGTGIHIICKGELPEGGRRKNNIEMYERGRFFTITGNVLSKCKKIAQCTETIKPLHTKYIGKNLHKSSDNYMNFTPNYSNTYDVIEKIKTSKQAEKFDDLYTGNWQIYYKSQSEADIALCNILAFWCQGDSYTMDSIFRSSALMREKWDRRQNGTTYGNIVIQKAIRDCTCFYIPINQDNYNIYIDNDAPQKPKIYYTADDTGTGEWFSDMYQHKIKYNCTDNTWYIYDGKRWKEDVIKEIYRLADEFTVKMKDSLTNNLEDTIKKEYNLDNITNIEEKEKVMIKREKFRNEQTQAITKRIKKARNVTGKKAFLTEAQSKLPLPINTTDFDTDKMILNVQNGVLNLKTGELNPHSPDLLLSKICAANYNTNAKCSKWLEFLNVIFNRDEELIKFIQKMVGYTLTGSTKEQCLFFLYGDGSNGKSVFTEIIAHIMGDYAINIQADSLMTKMYTNSSGPNDDIARLVNARLVTSSEPNEGSRLDEGLIKQLTGGDKVTARRLRASFFDFRPDFKLFISSNHKPYIRGTDIGIWRRLKVIPFLVLIPPEKQDKNLKNKLLEESDGILTWAIEGLKMYLKEGLQSPQSVKVATEEYKVEMDVIGRFLEEVTEESEESRISSSHLYQDYCKWADGYNVYKMTATKFGLEMNKRYRKIKSDGLIYYKGVTFKSSIKSK